MKAIHILLLVVMVWTIGASCATMMNNESAKSTEQLVSNTYSTIERELFMSTPLYKGPDSVLLFFERRTDFIRNKEYDYGNGSVRFNAHSAFFAGIPLIDDKSLFLLNYHIGVDPQFFLFQAIYHFKNETDKNVIYERMINVLEELQLLKETQYDIEKTPYRRYYLPDGTGFNFKHSAAGKEKHFIDILWVPDVE